MENKKSLFKYIIDKGLSFSKNIFIDRKIKNKLNFLTSFSIFRGLNLRELSYVYTIMFSKKYYPDEVIFEEGKLGKAVFFISSGEIEVSKKDNKKKNKVVKILKCGDFFGELALLEEINRAATAKVIKPAKLYFIYKSNFDGLIIKRPRTGIKIIRNLLDILGTRLREINQRISE